MLIYRKPEECTGYKESEIVYDDVVVYICPDDLTQ